jgi:transglutaminase-like putative cysteine protease
MMYRIAHTTTYEYADNAEACNNIVRLQPRDLPTQRCHEMQLSIEPAPDRIHGYRDYFGNHVHSFAVYEAHRQFSIRAESIVTYTASETTSLEETPPWKAVRDTLQTDRSPAIVAAIEHRFDSPYVRASAALRELAIEHFSENRPLGDAVLSLTKFIQRNFKYDPKSTTIDTQLEDVLEKRRGVCQDFAHLLIGCLRSLGLASRYVSGYLRTDPQPGKPRLLGADASHAWVSVFCPNSGWLDFDPTNGCRTSDRHITIGWGRDFHDVSPVKGVVLGGGESSLNVSVDVLPVEGDNCQQSTALSPPSQPKIGPPRLELGTKGL